MFLALHRSLVDAPFFAARETPSSPSSSSLAVAAEAVAAAAAAPAAAAAEAGAAHHSSSSSLSSSPSPSVVRLASGLAAVVATEPRTRAAEADSPPVLRAAVLFVGRISNEKELAREYSFEMATGDPNEDDLAATVLDLYGKNFADESGDSSDEPAALLSMLRGSWALAVVAERAVPSSSSSSSSGVSSSSTGLHVIVARSSNGKEEAKKEGGEDDEMEEDEEEEDEVEKPSSALAPPAPPPLYWGVTENNPECLVISSTPQPGLSPFPAGCFYESSPVSATSASEDGSRRNGNVKNVSRLDNFSRRAASKATREVLVAVPSPRGGGTGVIRPLQYKTRSGKDLKVVE